MAPRYVPAREKNTTNHQQGGRSAKESAFRGHLTVYLCVGLFLFTLNLLTSPGELWFYWPLFFWGWALVFQAVATYGADAPARVLEVVRSIVPGLSNPPPISTGETGRADQKTPFAAAAFAAVHDRIERLKEAAWRLPEGLARTRADRICALAEQIVAAMATNRASAETVNWFGRELLAPAETLLDRYARLANRGVTSADDAPRRVEEHDLALLETRFEDLYDRLHRGQNIGMAVASEMLDLEPPSSPRSSAPAHS